MLGKEDLKKALNTPRYEGIAKNVIFFVGDGMGVPTHTMSRIYKVSFPYRGENLIFERFSHAGSEERGAGRGGKPHVGGFSLHRAVQDLQHG